MECSDSPLQRFDFALDRTIRITATPELCVGVGEAAGEPAGGPSHLRRLLRIYSCVDHPASLTSWLTPGPTLG